MDSKGQSAAEILVGAIFLMIVYVAISGAVLDERRLSSAELDAQLKYAYCSSVAEKLDLTSQRRLGAYYIRAEYDTVIEQHHVRVGESLCRYQANVKNVDADCGGNNTFTFLDGNWFSVHYLPSSCSGNPYSIVIPQGDSVCGNGVAEEGEQCGETGLSCPTNFSCQTCVCIPNNPAAAQGCVLLGTQIETPQGRVPIETISAGDPVFAMDGNRKTTTRVKEIQSVVRDHFFEIKAKNALIRLTGEHPLSTPKGFVQAQAIKPGDLVQLMGSHGIENVEVSSVRRFNEPIVAFDVLLEGPHVFLAEGFAVHNSVALGGPPEGPDPTGGSLPQPPSMSGDSFVIGQKSGWGWT